ncbi:hypothetical protein BHE74_00007224, partial [Ensete ventricosum]
SPTFYCDDPFVSHPDSSEKVPGVRGLVSSELLKGVSCDSFESQLQFAEKVRRFGLL